MNGTIRSISVLGLSLLAAAPAWAQSPMVELRVYPTDVQLATSRDRQTYVVQAVQEDGITRDVTAEAQVSFANAALVRHEKNTVYPAADGKTEMTVAYGGKSVTVPVTVAHATDERPISFRLDVMPVFMKSSCNNGSCHGAARGKD